MKDVDKKIIIQPKDLLAVQKVAIRLINTSISLIFLGFIVEKLEFFLYIFKIYSQKTHHLLHPKMMHSNFYNYLGVAIIIFGVLLSAYSYWYYISWIRHLNAQNADREKNIYFLISLFITFIGAILIISMIYI